MTAAAAPSRANDQFSAVLGDGRGTPPPPFEGWAYREAEKVRRRYESWSEVSGAADPLTVALGDNFKERVAFEVAAGWADDLVACIVAVARAAAGGDFDIENLGSAADGFAHSDSTTYGDLRVIASNDPGLSGWPRHVQLTVRRADAQDEWETAATVMLSAQHAFELAAAVADARSRL